MLIKFPDGHTLVAVSGGADSVALLCMLHDEGRNIEALHCNFHLRGEESNRDEQFVTRLCERLNIPLHIKHFDTLTYAKEKGISIEMAARELRYQWFEDMRRQQKAEYIAVAHHRDDQAETVLLNLIRGTGLRGLGGMKVQHGHIIRPLLNTSKSDILNYLTSIGQDYVTDSSNMEREAQRNSIRLDVIPLLKQLNPKAVEHICEAANRVNEALPYYLRGIDNSADLTPTTLHERLQGCGFTATQEADMLKENRTGALFESETHRVVRNRGKLIVEEKKEITQPQLQQQVIEVDDALAWLKKQGLTTDIAYLDADKLPSTEFAIRHPRTGDRFQPYGMNGKSRLVSDFLTDKKLSLLEKERQWLVCCNNHIVWVAGLRINHLYRVTEKTRRILVLTVEQ